MPSPEDGSVLKKVISFTLDQMNNADDATEKAARPSFVPEKLDFNAYEQFKGELTLNVSLLAVPHYNIDIDQFGCHAILSCLPKKKKVI